MADYKFINPRYTETFFEYPTDAKQDGDLEPYYIQSSGNLLRLSGLGKRAFCCVLEGLVERATYPLLNDLVFPPHGEWRESLRVASGGAGGIPMMPIGNFMDAAFRDRIRRLLFRCGERGIWRNFVTAVFSLFFHNTSMNITDASGEWPNNEIDVYPLGMDPWRVDTGCHDIRSFSMKIPRLSTDMEWFSEYCMWYEPNTERADKSDILKQDLIDDLVLLGIPSEYIGIEMVDHDLEKNGIINENTLRSIELDTVRNFWERPRNSIASLQSGPVPASITIRRNLASYGIAQAMLAALQYSYYKCPVGMDFTIVHRKTRMTWFFSFSKAPDGEPEVIIGEPETEYINDDIPHYSSPYWLRERELGQFTNQVQAWFSTTMSKDNPAARSASYLRAINPNFDHGGWVEIPGASENCLWWTGDEIFVGEVTSRSEIWYPKAGNAEDIKIQDVYPQKNLSDNVEEININIVSAINDSMDLSDLGGQSRGRGLIYFCKTHTGPNFRQAVVEYENALTNDAELDGANIMPKFIAPHLDAYTPDLLSKAASDLKLIYASYGPSWEEDGETYYLPWGIEPSDQSSWEMFNLNEAQGTYEAIITLRIAAQNEDVWGDATPISGWAEYIGHTNAFGSIKWKWDALPTGT